MDKTFPSTVKRPKKSAMTLYEKTVVNNIYSTLRYENPPTLFSVDQIVDMCINMTGIGRTTIYKLLKEKKQNGQFSEPKKCEGRKPIQLDDERKNTLRRIVHSYFFKNVLPTLQDIASIIEKDDSFPNMGRTKLWTIFRELDFVFLRKDKKRFLIERSEVILWRRNYLTQIKLARQQGKPIFYLSETCLGDGDLKTGQDKKAKIEKQTAKERRVIVTHIGGESGFVEGGLFMFESKETGNNDEDINAAMFEEWFSEIIQKLPSQSIIILDKSSNNTQRPKKLPSISWRKAEVAAWLESKAIPFDPTLIKAELLSLIKIHKDKYFKYVVDEIASERGLTVLRLPPYHSDLNPIELIWTRIKGYVMHRDKSFNIVEMRQFLEKVLSAIDSNTWAKCIDSIKKKEVEMWDLDDRIDSAVDGMAPFNRSNVCDGETDSSDEMSE